MAISKAASDLCSSFPGLGATAIQRLFAENSVVQQTDRLRRPVHLTCSLRVSDRSGLSLIIEHPKLGLATFPGGHADAGERLIDAAAREFEEETGLILSREHRQRIVVAGWGLHEVRQGAEVAHWHLDVLYSLDISSGLRQGEVTERIMWEWRAAESVLRSYLLFSEIPLELRRPEFGYRDAR